MVKREQVDGNATNFSRIIFPSTHALSRAFAPYRRALSLSLFESCPGNFDLGNGTSPLFLDLNLEINFNVRHRDHWR